MSIPSKPAPLVIVLVCALATRAWADPYEPAQDPDETSPARPEGAFAAHGEDCRIRLVGALASEWARAVAQVESLRTGRDCARVDVGVGPTGAMVTFVTRDGRTARRLLEGPSELSSTLEALQETGGMLGLPDRGDGVIGPAAPGPMREAPPVVHAAVPTSDAVPWFQPIFSLGFGMRGGADYLVSPTVEGTVALDLQHWQVGVHLGVELRYMDMQQPARETGTSITSGLLLGRREPLGRLLVHYGGRLLHSTSSNEADADGRHGHFNETRLGAYLGMVLFRASSVRFRADVAADIVPLDLGGAGFSGGSASPWWATSLLLGVELGGARR